MSRPPEDGLASVKGLDFDLLSDLKRVPTSELLPKRMRFLNSVDKGLLTLRTGRVARGREEVQELRRHPRQEPGQGGGDGRHRDCLEKGSKLKMAVSRLIRVVGRKEHHF